MSTHIRPSYYPARRALDTAERRALVEALHHYAQTDDDPHYQGRYETAYTDAFTAYHGGGYADAVATGTAAVYVAIRALSLPAGSTVLCSPITDPGTLGAIVLAGLRPKLIDSARGSYNVGVEQFLMAHDASVSAAVIVHSLGAPAPIERICQLARSFGLRVIEDCSQAHGARVGGRLVGTFGDIAAYSTMARKAHVTGGCGGVVYTRNERLYQQALAHADRGKPRWTEGFDDRDPAMFLFPALNLHTDELSCAIGCASLGRLDDTIRRRLAFVGELAALMDGRTVFRPVRLDPCSSPFVLPVYVDGDARAYATALQAQGVPLNPSYRYVCADWPWLRPYLPAGNDTPNARQARDQSFALYLNEHYTTEHAEAIWRSMMKVSKRSLTRRQYDQG